MQLQATLGKRKYQFEVTPLVDSKRMLYFLIELSDGQLMVAQHIQGKGKWLKAAYGQVSIALSGAIFKKIESASVYILLEKMVYMEQLKQAIAMH